MYSIDQTHSPDLRSWVESANDPTSDFPIQNLPFCVFQRGASSPSIGVGIGDQILDLKTCASSGWLSGLDPAVQGSLLQTTLNDLMGLPLKPRNELRTALSQVLDANTTTTTVDRTQTATALVPQAEAQLLIPARISDYTDFYASIYHATNVGIMLRPNHPLLPNYKHIPIGYHGRASSVVVSGTSVRRPWGQLGPLEEGISPTFDTCKTLDYELELGCFIGQGNRLGEPISIGDAEDHLFGICLLNDWSARDVQKWEYQPLGPFLAKSFATSISPWVVTMEALAPFRCAEFQRPTGDPAPLNYLSSQSNSAFGGIDLNLEVHFRTAKMKEQGMESIPLTAGKFQGMYWTLAQMLTHHSSNGCNFQPGDLIASGTVSGPDRNARGSLLELTWDGDVENPLPGSSRTAFKLPTGEERKFLGDGDEVTLAGYCSNAHYRRIGLGKCVGTIEPANKQ